MSSTHTIQRTLKRLREDGYRAEVVERWVPNPKIPSGGIRRDLAGFADIIATNGLVTYAIQCCVGSGDVAKHMEKLVNLKPEHAAFWRSWVQAGGFMQLWSWAKRGERGKRKLWMVVVRDVSRALLSADPDPRAVEAEQVNGEL